MKLYISPGACSLSPHIVLREAGLPYELERVLMPTKKTTSGADYLDINPKGYVPALALDDGTMLTEGVAIVQYLADLKPESKLAPAAGTMERVRLQEWLTYVSSEIHKGFSPLFSPKAPEEWKVVCKEGLATKFDYLSKTLDEKSFLMGETFTVADAYLFTVLQWTKYVGMDLATWPKLKAYSDRVAARPAVKAAIEAEQSK
ncbi:MAG: glutathione transferase GstA [Polyangiales bacterium]